VIGGGVLGEAIIHRCFDPVRVKPGGKDWFRSCPVLWKFIISASEHGRPDWLPAESDRVIFKLDDLVDEFGAFQKIVPLLGYSNELYFMQALKWQTKNGYVLQARVEFLRLLRDGMLPSYIANMHEDLLEALRPSREAKRAAA
jgi:hypothetical protein